MRLPGQAAGFARRIHRRFTPLPTYRFCYWLKPLNRVRCDSTLVGVSEVKIQTPRGLELAGSFVHPVDAGDAAVLFSHSFLSDRTSGGRFETLATMYRSLGYSTMTFDYSGHGASDDAEIELDQQVEDLRAASGWLADQGCTRQLLHAHSFGTLAALKGRPKHVRTMFLTSPILGPRYYDWNQIFSQDQLELIEKRQAAEVPDDSEGDRECFLVNQQTLVDLSLTPPEALAKGLEVPVFMAFDKEDVQMGLVELATTAFPMFADGSRIEVEGQATFSNPRDLPGLVELARNWALQHLPAKREAK